MLFLCAQVAIQISEANDYNYNVDSFMTGHFCMLFVMIVGFRLGKVGGVLGAKRATWLGILLAFLGGLLVPLIFLLPLTCLILLGWANT